MTRVEGGQNGISSVVITFDPARKRDALKRRLPGMGRIKYIDQHKELKRVLERLAGKSRSHDDFPTPA